MDHNDWRTVIIVKMLFIKMTFSTPKVLLVDNVLINNLIVLTLDLRNTVEIGNQTMLRFRQGKFLS